MLLAFVVKGTLQPTLLLGRPLDVLDAVQQDAVPFAGAVVAEELVAVVVQPHGELGVAGQQAFEVGDAPRLVHRGP